MNVPGGSGKSSYRCLHYYRPRQPLTLNKVRVPLVIALGGEKAQGGRIAEMVALVAETVEGGSVPDCGHFIPEERPDEIVRRVRLRSIRNTSVQSR